MNNKYLQKTYAPDSLDADKKKKKNPNDNKFKNLGFMKFNSVSNTHPHKNDKNPVLGMFQGRTGKSCKGF